ncbi:hypothetical protein AB0C01_24015 [Micromonospora sp. NPDC048905]
MRPDDLPYLPSVAAALAWRREYLAAAVAGAGKGSTSTKDDGP